VGWRRTVAIAALVIGLVAVFFFAPIVALPTTSGCLTPNVHTCVPASGFTVDRVVSPSCLLFGVGEVQFHVSNFAGGDTKGTVFTWNCGSLIQYGMRLYYH
jgi:hypothetical protein